MKPRARIKRLTKRQQFRAMILHAMGHTAKAIAIRIRADETAILRYLGAD